MKMIAVGFTILAIGSIFFITSGEVETAVLPPLFCDDYREKDFKTTFIPYIKVNGKEATLDDIYTQFPAD